MIVTETDTDTRSHPLVGSTVPLIEAGATGAVYLLIVAILRGGDRADGYTVGRHFGEKRTFLRRDDSNLFVEKGDRGSFFIA